MKRRTVADVMTKPDRRSESVSLMDNAAVSETHIGIVFFTADRAYKLKKPVNLGFLDFSTREL
ncbi:hypothetical protein ETD83_42150, partial [Actinomadura soli]